MTLVNRTGPGTMRSGPFISFAVPPGRPRTTDTPRAPYQSPGATYPATGPIHPLAC